jgi:HAE1 family hydrophobic/amphiphilic exporter-1
MTDLTEPQPSEPKGIWKGGAGIAALCVSRPVLTIVLNLLIVVAGLAALGAIEVRELPSSDQPVITVRTSYTGATPEVVDKEVTSVIEGAVARIPGIVSIASQSSSGNSRVTITFAEDVDLETATNDLRDALGNNARGLPDDAGTPSIFKTDSESSPIAQLAVTSPIRPIDDLTQVVEDRIIPRLAAVEGVADVQVFGTQASEVRIVVDPNALTARGLTVTDLQNALDDIALDSPAGSLADPNRSIMVRADASVKSAEEISAIQINQQTRVGDVAGVIFGPSARTTSLRINGEPGIGLSIVRAAQSNTLEISGDLHRVIDDLNATLPDDLNVIVTSDDATFIEGAIEEVVWALILATAIVIGIIYVFLRSARITFIPAITVPVALIGTLAAMWLVGFSINILTLLALVLATGLVVDDAIVVIENISRRRAEGMGPRAAAVLGTRQVFFAVISTTATLAAVFIPISFLPGQAGELFTEFGFVLAFSVALSAVVALTLVPMLASRLIGPEKEEHERNPLSRLVGRFGSMLAAIYRRILSAAVNAPLVAIILFGLFASGAWFAFTTIPQELAPAEDRGVVSINLSTPLGATINYTEEQLGLVEAAVEPLIENGEATHTFAVVRSGGEGAFITLTLAPWGERSRSQSEIAADLTRRLSSVPGVSVQARSGNSLGLRAAGNSGGGLSFVVTGTEYNEIYEGARVLQAAMEESPLFDTVTINYNTTQPELSLPIDRERATDLGVSINQLSSIVRILLDGQNVGEFFVGDTGIPVRVDVPEGMIQGQNDLDNIPIETNDGRFVPLSSLVRFEESAVAPNLNRQDQRRAINVSATLTEGTALSDAIPEMRRLADEALPQGMETVLTGEAAQLQQTSNDIVYTFIFAIIVVVLVLAAQFESFTSALILFATVPFGLAAAVYSMVLTGNSLNLFSEIGLVMLVGIMAKNGILIVEFANQLRDQGQSVKEAIINASNIRLRPVVMTMIATILGGVPLLLQGGAGAESRASLGWIIVGGLGLATFATLFLTPVVYSVVARISKPRAAEEHRLATELANAERGPVYSEPIAVAEFRPAAE